MRVVQQLRLPEWIVLGLTIALALWSWIAYVVGGPQDFGTWGWIFAGSLVIGSVVQMVFFVYVRPSGTLRQRLGFSTMAPVRGGWIVLLAPAVVIGIILLIVTPPDTSVSDFSRDMSVYQVIGIVTLLSLLFTYLGAGAIFFLIVVPLGLLVAAVLPETAKDATRPSTDWTRTQLVTGGLVVFCVIGFALSITGVAASAASSSRGRMIDQLIAFITFTGNPVATAATWFFIAAIVVLAIVNNRSTARSHSASTDSARSRKARA